MNQLLARLLGRAPALVDGYDSIQVGNIPADAGAVVCYMDRRFKNDDQARARFPQLSAAGRIVTLTAGLDPTATGIDCEPGNSNPFEAAGWLRDRVHAGAWRPVGYADLSDMRTLISQLHLDGIPTPPPGPGRPTRLYSAHPTGVRHICGPSTCGFPVDVDGTQWWWSSLQNPGGPDLDKNVFRADFFLGAPAPPTPHPIRKDDMITAIVNRDGRLEVFVEKADTGEVFHAIQEHENGGWYGAQAGKRNALWYSLGKPGQQ